MCVCVCVEMKLNGGRGRVRRAGQGWVEQGRAGEGQGREATWMVFEICPFLDLLLD